ncbi:MAG: hypothetical protein Q8N63_01475 [Nanoarchaeota archaeon]|nr:hypothetical protein [Nanoarchaeota archaeon]
MGVKNSQIYIRIETQIKDRIKLEAFEEGVSISEFCRQKIREKPRLTRIELMLERLLKRKY